MSSAPALIASGKVRSPAPRLRPWFASERGVLLGAALVVLLAFVYARALGGEFLWDDDLHITANPTIVGPLGLGEIWTTARANYFPLVLTNFWVQHALWGVNPLGYHAVTLACHALAAMLLWGVLGELRVPGAWLGAALWALHPVQVESVAWICELKNTQSAAFFLAGVWAWLKWLDARRNVPLADGGKFPERGPKPRPAPRMRMFYWLALACAWLAVLSKASTVMLPIVLVLCGWWKRFEPDRRLVAALAPFFALSALAAVWTIWEQKVHSGAAGAEWAQSWPVRGAIAGRAMWFYLGQLVWPRSNFIYPRWVIAAANPLAYLPLVLAALAMAALWMRRAKSAAARAALFGAMFFVALLFPVLGFFDVYFFRYSYVSDHFQYLASIAPLTLLGAAIASRGPAVRWIAGGLAVVAFGVQAAAQSGDYRSKQALWGATVARNPGSAMAWVQLGSALEHASRDREATACFQRALELNPNHAEALNHLGVEFLAAGRRDEAITELQRALAIRPDFPAAHGNLGVVLLQAGRAAEALPHLERAANAWPDLAELRYHVGEAQRALGRWPDAIASYEHVLRLEPEFPSAHERLGLALLEAGRPAEARPHLESAVRTDPARAELHDALGLALAGTGNASAAIAEYERALQLQPGLASAHNNLGVALGQAGKMVDALAQFDAAVRLAPAYVPAYVNRGGALVALGRLSDARDAFARAIELQPDSAKAHTYLGQLLHALGDDEQARQHLERAAQLEHAAPAAP